MASLKQIKKKVKSIRQFVKAFTTSSRSSRKECKVAKRWNEENSRLIQEEHSEQKVSLGSVFLLLKWVELMRQLLQMGGADYNDRTYRSQVPMRKKDVQQEVKQEAVNQTMHV